VAAGRAAVASCATVEASVVTAGAGVTSAGAGALEGLELELSALMVGLPLPTLGLLVLLIAWEVVLGLVLGPSETIYTTGRHVHQAVFAFVLVFRVVAVYPPYLVFEVSAVWLSPSVTT
jgi:hypothetical protein